MALFSDITNRKQGNGTTAGTSPKSAPAVAPPASGNAAAPSANTSPTPTAAPAVSSTRSPQWGQHLQGQLRRPESAIPAQASREQASAWSPRRISMTEIVQRLNPEPSEEQLEKERKKQKREQIFAAISDGISALSNLYFTTQYAPNMYSGRNTASERTSNKWARLADERAANMNAYIRMLTEAQRADDAYNDKERQWRRTLGLDKEKREKEAAERERKEADAAFEREQLEYKKERDRIEDEQWQKEFDERKRANNMRQVRGYGAGSSSRSSSSSGGGSGNVLDQKGSDILYRPGGTYSSEGNIVVPNNNRANIALMNASRWILKQYPEFNPKRESGGTYRINPPKNRKEALDLITKTFSKLYETNSPHERRLPDGRVTYSRNYNQELYDLTRMLQEGGAQFVDGEGQPIRESRYNPTEINQNKYQNYEY